MGVFPGPVCIFQNDNVKTFCLAGGYASRLRAGGCPQDNHWQLGYLWQCHLQWHRAHGMLLLHHDGCFGVVAGNQLFQLGRLFKPGTLCKHHTAGRPVCDLVPLDPAPPSADVLTLVVAYMHARTRCESTTVMRSTPNVGADGCS